MIVLMISSHCKYVNIFFKTFFRVLRIRAMRPKTRKNAHDLNIKIFKSQAFQKVLSVNFTQERITTLSKKFTNSKLQVIIKMSF